MASKKNAAPAVVASETVADPDATTQIVSYSVTEEEIRETFARYAGLSFETPEGYELGRKALGHIRETRVAIEKRRKFLKADSLAYGRKIDSVAKYFTSLLEEIELPLQAKKDAVDEEKARQRREKDDAEREAIRQAELAKMAEQQAELEAQRVQFLADQSKLAEEQREMREATDRLDAERRAVAAERERITQAEAKLVQESEPLPQQVAELIPNPDWVSGGMIERATTAAASALPLTDTDHLRSFAAELRALEAPMVISDTAGAIIEQVEFMISEAIAALESYSEAQPSATAAE